MSDKKKYSLSISRAYRIKGGVWSTDIGPVEFDALQQIQIGGRLVYRELKEESRKDKKISPHGYFQYMTPQEVSSFKDKIKKNSSNSDDSGF